MMSRMPELCGRRSVRLPQHHLRSVLHVGNKQKSLRRERIWSIARQGLQWSNRLDDAPPVGICSQDCEWLQASQTAGDWIPPDRLDRWSEAGVLSPQSEADPRGQLNLLLPMPGLPPVHFRWAPSANALHWQQLPVASNFLCHRRWEQHLAHRPKPASFVRSEYWR